MKNIKWEIGSYGDCISNGDYVIAEKPHGNSTNWNKNSILMVAAPELLEACKQAQEWLFGDKRATHISFLLREAIVKAEGRS